MVSAQREPQLERHQMAKDFIESTAEDRALISSEEGRIPYVYDDAVFPTRKYVKGTKIKGNLTAGVGHLLSRGSKIFPEAKQWIGKTIPASVIDQWLDDDLDEAEKAVHEKVKVPLKPHQRGTLISFTFNVGVGAFAGSTLLRKLNQKNYNAVPTELAKWTKTTINGKKVTSKGLVARRAREAAYWSDAIDVAPLPKTKTKIEPKSTEIAEPSVQKWTPTEITGIGGVIGSAIVAGFSTTEPVLVYVFAGVIAVAALIAAGVFVKRQFFPS